MSVNWNNLLDDFGRAAVRLTGCDPEYPFTHGHFNFITQAMADDPTFIERAQELEGFSRVAMSRAATICQMMVYDNQNGPERDGKCKSLRRHWYAWYKTHFAQPLAFALGDTKPNGQGVLEMDDQAWSARLSVTYAEFVDSGKVTYKDLWVEDASRMMESFYDRLFQGCHIIIAVEKDSLFADFHTAAKAMGAISIYSGKGKSSKAAIEKVLRDHFHWHPDYEPFRDDPLIVLHISDHDYDGEQVIGPTFAEQARRYTDNILEARVGIKPAQVGKAEWQSKWYQVKVSNAGYKSWAEEKALFLAQCSSCGHRWPVVGTSRGEESERRTHTCPQCWCGALTVRVGEATPHGFEVEAKETRDYYRLLVEALLEVLPFDYIVKKLREECVADATSAARSIAEDIYKDNADYQRLLAKFEELEQIKDDFERMVEERLTELGEPHVQDWEDEDDDPEPEDFKRHVHEADDWAGPWRPFRRSDRTYSLVEYLKEAHDDVIEDLTYQTIDF